MPKKEEVEKEKKEKKRKVRESVLQGERDYYRVHGDIWKPGPDLHLPIFINLQLLSFNNLGLKFLDYYVAKHASAL
jgi:hypothetical protein